MQSPKWGLRALAPLALALGLGACTVSTGPSSAPSSSITPDGTAIPTSSEAPTVAPTPAPSSSQLQIVGVEYAFQGVPATIEAGTTLTFTNDGKEVHEMAIVRRKPGVTKTWDELMSMPNDEAEALVETVGMSLALPGQEATDAVTLDQAGEYLMICLVPTGTTSIPSNDPGETSGAEAPPHAMQGMVTPFTVVD